MPTCGAGTVKLGFSDACESLPGYTTPPTSIKDVFTAVPNNNPQVGPDIVARTLTARINYIITKINEAKTAVTTAISPAYLKNLENSGTGRGQTGSRLSDLKREELSADTAFREAEAAAQASGLQGRKRTLQEFIITFFFIAFLVLTITLMIRSYTILQDWNEAFKILGLMTIVYGCIWGILVRYA